ncbi:hypothetical protein OF897_12400 [Chryseobacterium formosus]|uniref:Uncharacterized protein n=1 Tax=Chryseobacterium formosus TaxID=1537363 RepID=A0ABT3XT90_9FLAO|nr:hypothetical protein [Chryseobacterium formosus]MCX8524713.1 hypothetical protein [Chryseobacterium formosus]
MMNLTHYFANAIDIDGNEIEIPVNEEGIVQIWSTKKLKNEI